MEKDTTGVYTQQPFWFNLNFKPFNATLHLTYYNFKDWQQFDSLVSDTRKLAFKHLQRADDIPEIPVFREDGLRGLIFDIKGNTATHMNFYLTDSSRHFFRGALYFNKQTNPDSIAPVIEFVKQDVNHLISTFNWK
jgi:gliding motility-associated lipoprotein GldD